MGILLRVLVPKDYTDLLFAYNRSGAEVFRESQRRGHQKRVQVREQERLHIDSDQMAEGAG